MTVTLFTTLKPSDDGGIIDTIQYNAVMSWMHLPVRILVFGRESNNMLETLSLQAAYRGLPGKMIHPFEHVAVNEYGTPLIKPMFEFANACGSETMCYINADMILARGFMEAIATAPRSRYLMIGHRHNLSVTERLEFGISWAEEMTQRAHGEGVRAVSAAIDFFIHSRELWGNLIPEDLTLARYYWDNHLTWLAGSVVRAPVIDASKIITAVHQDHPPITSFSSPEAKSNEAIVAYRMAGIEHSTHHLDEAGQIQEGPVR